jgi:hypothetical protein
MQNILFHFKRKTKKFIENLIHMYLTERTRIRVCLEAVTKQIESNRIKFERFMESSFTEREKLYKRLDNMLVRAVEIGDTEMAKVALNFILTVYNKKPMEGLEVAIEGVGNNLLAKNDIKNYLD